MGARTSGFGRRIVVTGMGCVSPLGHGVEANWSAATAGQSGIAPITLFDTEPFSIRFAGEVKGEVALPGVSPKERRRLDRSVAFALAAAAEALSASGLEPVLEVDDSLRDRVGVAIGSGIGGLDTLLTNEDVLVASGPRRVSPFTIPMAIANMPSGYVSLTHGLRGPNYAHVSACASATHAIGEAAHVIARGDAVAMLAGGTEAAVVPLGIAGFAAMRALSTRGDEPQRASRPFDTGRDGFVLGEGAAVLLLEDYEHARARGARIRGELLGYAATADAVHMAAPEESGAGAARCMRLALERAGLPPERIGHLNAHATSTPVGDPAEVAAVRQVFGDAVDGLAVSATKSMTGHLLGAAGSLEAVLTLRALETGLLPPTINLDELDPACALDHVANKVREAAVDVALSNSFGFGGTNACLVMGRADG